MKKIASLFLAAACLAPSLAIAQVAAQANKTYQTHQGRETIAKALSDPARDERQRPRDIVDALDLSPAESVADVGTGVGFMLPYLSHAVGDKGHVYAEDIQTDFLDQAKTKVQLNRLNNVQFILGTAQDPKLPADTLSGVLVLDVYHHFDYPEAMLGHIRDSLLSDGKLVIVEYFKRPGAMQNADPNFAVKHIRLDQDDLIKEVEANGFRLASVHDLVPKSQYVAVFLKK